MSKTYLIDIDQTISKTDGLAYERAEPILNNINTVNRLFDEGNTIIIWTGRGLSKGPEESLKIMQMTRNQLRKWNVKFHKFIQKPVDFDFVIDDKAIESHTFFSKQA